MAGLAGRLVEQNVGVGVSRRIAVDKVSAGVGENFRVPQPFEIVAE